MKKGKGIQGLLLQQARHRKRLPDKDKHELKNQYACHMSQTEFAELRSWIEPESEQYRTNQITKKRYRPFCSFRSFHFYRLAYYLPLPFMVLFLFRFNRPNSKAAINRALDSIFNGLLRFSHVSDDSTNQVLSRSDPFLLSSQRRIFFTSIEWNRLRKLGKTPFSFPFFLFLFRCLLFSPSSIVVAPKNTVKINSNALLNN